MKYKVSFTNDKTNGGTYSFNVDASNMIDAGAKAVKQRDKIFLKEYIWKQIVCEKIAK